MTIKPDPDSDFVAQKARETFNKIKELRKSSPQKYAWQREELKKQIKLLEDEWWEQVSPIIVKKYNTRLQAEVSARES